jgi:hypothetical protein
MDKRISRAVAAAAVVTMPLLAGCGASRAPESGSAAPASTQPAAPTTDTAASTTPSPGGDQAQETKDVQAATKKFATTVLTVGYPDKTFDEYLERLEPLMTKKGLRALDNKGSEKRVTDTLKSLSPQHARLGAELASNADVTSLDDSAATAKLDYDTVGQVNQGGRWRTVKSLGSRSVTVKLVKDGGKWLVDSAA